MFPIKAGDELGVNLLGKPQRIFATQQGGREVVAQGQHEDHDAARQNAGCRMRNHDLAQDGRAVAAQVIGRFYQGVVQAFERADQRHHHEQHGGVHQAHQNRGIAVKQFHGRGRDAQPHQQGGQHARLAQQNHPAQGAHGFADPEGDQAQHQQQRLGPPAYQFGDGPGNRKGQQQRHQGGQYGQRGGAHKGVPIQRLLNKRAVLRHAELVLARCDAFAQGQHRQVDMRQHNQADQPDQGGRQQQQKHEPGLRRG